MPRVPNADETRNQFELHVIGNKTDAAVQAGGTTKSIIAYLKGILDVLTGATGVSTFPAALTPANGVSLAEVLRFMCDTQGRPIEVVGEADMDVSESDYTAFITLLTITPAAGEPLLDLAIDLDYNKATTGFDNVATAADVLDVAIVGKTDGTNWRCLMNGTQITANGNGTLEASEDGERFNVGMVGVDGEVRVMVKVDTERGDVEIPYRLTYRGAAPTVTAVAAV